MINEVDVDSRVTIATSLVEQNEANLVLMGIEPTYWREFFDEAFIRENIFPTKLINAEQKCGR